MAKKGNGRRFDAQLRDAGQERFLRVGRGGGDFAGGDSAALAVPQQNIRKGAAGVNGNAVAGHG